MTLGITKGSTVPKPTGVAFLDEYGEHIETLYETGSRPLTAVGGTANVVTATMTVDLTAAGLVDGLCVSITWIAANTAGVTLAINGGAAIPVLDATGAALTAGVITPGLTSLLRYTSGNWRVISGFGAAGAAVGPSYQVFTASGTWTKPAGYDPNTTVLVQAWGGGGGGARSSISNSGRGGGGGGYMERMFRMSELPASVAVTIGAGGAAGALNGGLSGAGGNTTFGSLLTAFGGGASWGEASSTAVAAGGGGGENAAGGNGATGGINGVGGRPGGGSGSAAAGGLTVCDALTIFGGGGGRGGNTTSSAGFAVYGGGGGGGGSAPGGTSLFGGNGGGEGQPGAVPGGGGGGGSLSGPSAAGARGELRITIMT